MSERKPSYSNQTTLHFKREKDSDEKSILDRIMQVLDWVPVINWFSWLYRGHKVDSYQICIEDGSIFRSEIHMSGPRDFHDSRGEEHWYVGLQLKNIKRFQFRYNGPFRVPEVKLIHQSGHCRIPISGWKEVKVVQGFCNSLGIPYGYGVTLSGAIWLPIWCVLVGGLVFIIFRALFA